MNLECVINKFKEYLTQIDMVNWEFEAIFVENFGYVIIINIINNLKDMDNIRIGGSTAFIYDIYNDSFIPTNRCFLEEALMAYQEDNHYELNLINKNIYLRMTEGLGEKYNESILSRIKHWILKS